MKLKHALPSTLLKRLNAYAHQHPLYQALIELGKVIRTIFILQYMDDDELRRRTHQQTTQIESVQKLAQVLNMGDDKVVQFATKEELLTMAQSRQLIINNISCFNYILLSKLLLESPLEDRKAILKWKPTGYFTAIPYLKPVWMMSLFLFSYGLSLAKPTPVKDINTTTTKIIQGLDPRGLTAVNDILYFSGYDAVHGRELWRSDGTLEGTYLVKDLNPGTSSASPSNLLNVSGTLYFAATTQNAGDVEIWKSDGTTAGTVLVGTSSNQITSKLWDKTLGGGNADDLSVSIATADGGYLLAGTSYSGIGGDKTQASQGGNDYWVVKTNSSGCKTVGQTFWYHCRRYLNISHTDK